MSAAVQQSFEDLDEDLATRAAIVGALRRWAERADTEDELVVGISDAAARLVASRGGALYLWEEPYAEG